MKNPHKLILPVIAFFAVLCLPSCQTGSATEPGVVKDTASQVEDDRCGDWKKSLKWSDGADQFNERWASLPEWAQKYLLAQDAAWEAACT